jgi:hypothetical protein
VIDVMTRLKVHNMAEGGLKQATISGNSWTWVEPYTDHSPSTASNVFTQLYMVYTVIP